MAKKKKLCVSARVCVSVCIKIGTGIITSSRFGGRAGTVQGCLPRSLTIQNIFLKLYVSWAFVFGFTFFCMIS